MGLAESRAPTVWKWWFCLVVVAARGAIRSAARRHGQNAQGLASGHCCGSQHHLISGRIISEPTSRIHAVKEAMRMGPIYEAAVVAAQGWHGHHPSRADRGTAAAPARRLKLSLDHRLVRHETGGQIAPQRNHQLASQSDDGDALDPLAGIDGAFPEPAAQCAVGLMQQP